MKKVVLSAVAALAVTAGPAFAADMPVKAYKAPPVAYVSPFDVAFGAAFTTDYVLRGISQSNRKPAVQGYFEGRYTINDSIQLYAGIWGSSLASYLANAEIDPNAGVRFTFGGFGLDLGYVYYYYPDGTSIPTGYGSFGEFYAKPSFKFNDWLTIGGVITGGNNFNGGYNIVGSKTAYFYAANATISLPWQVSGVSVALNPEIGRQVFECTGCTSYTWWNVGLVFNYKAVTLDLRYWDTNRHGVYLAPAAFGGKDLAGSTFVATLKFDTTLLALK
ncbi:MAG: TorF family putative porin [Pseudolabrys sp.]|nr:TorF family putative porin [Pseudolabrys sp.]